MKKYTLRQVSSVSKEALALSKKLFLELDAIYPDSMLENFIEENPSLKVFVIAFSESGKAVASGALKHYKSGVAEVKRMYVLKEFRGQGISAQILKELENIANEMNYKKLILETGIKQPEAISLYIKYGYNKTNCFGSHKNDPDSLCFEKNLE